MNILFLGAGKRFTLLESFFAAAKKEEVEVRLFSVENTEAVPISKLAKIFIGPSFRDEKFGGFLADIVAHNKIDLVIPNMDAATVVLAGLKQKLAAFGCHPVVSSADLCATMEDKIRSEQWFVSQGLSVPAREGFPCIVKHRLGFGSRDQGVFNNQAELEGFLSKRTYKDYIVQKFTSGQEYTVDAYVDLKGKIIAALSRKRLKVVDGEVDVSEVRRHTGILEITKKALSQPGWEGPLTLQFIDSPDGPIILEINPRFGGGVTHSIQAGLDMPRWIIRERLKRPLGDSPSWTDGSIMMRYRKDVFL